jgi:hypothetical protein
VQDFPRIKTFPSLLKLSRDVRKGRREHDLVIAVRKSNSSVAFYKLIVLVSTRLVGLVETVCSNAIVGTFHPVSSHLCYDLCVFR